MNTLIKSKVCSLCHKRKALDLFYKASDGKFGMRGECKVCTITRREKNVLKQRRLASKIQFATTTFIPALIIELIFPLFPVLVPAWI